MKIFLWWLLILFILYWEKIRQLCRKKMNQAQFPVASGSFALSGPAWKGLHIAYVSLPHTEAFSEPLHKIAHPGTSCKLATPFLDNFPQNTNTI